MYMNDYKVQKPYPATVNRPKYPSGSPTSLEVMEFAKKLEQYEKEKEQRDKEVQEYRVEEGKMREKFKSDLFKEFGIESNPKRDLLFSKAWELGHSDGFASVANYAQDLVELIQ
jgi:hypothetical protein